MLPALLLNLALAQSPAADTHPSERLVVVQPPQRIKWVAAVYPDEARRAGLAGEVVLDCSIDAKGKVTSLKVRRGVSPLYEAAIYAVMEWEFTPALHRGKPIRFETTETIGFDVQPFQYGGLMSSLDSATDPIRSAAARNLGELRLGADVDADEVEAALQRLDELATTDQAASVRSAARSAAARLRGQPESPAAAPASIEPPSQAPPGEPAPTPPSSERRAPSRVPVLDFDQPPKPIRSPRPVYPSAAFKARIEGNVLVEVLIDAQGRVSRSRVIRSTPGLDEAALATVRQWLFQPAVKNGQPCATLAHIPVQFRFY
jgi:TonB family protein